MKRSPLLRSKPLEAKTSTPVRSKKCKVCGEPFRAFRSIQSWCSPECGVKLAERLVAKKEARAAAEDKKQTRAQLDAV